MHRCFQRQVFCELEIPWTLLSQEGGGTLVASCYDTDWRPQDTPGGDRALRMLSAGEKREGKMVS